MLAVGFVFVFVFAFAFAFAFAAMERGSMGRRC
jgi:hypothetical protein